MICSGGATPEIRLNYSGGGKSPQCNPSLGIVRSPLALAGRHSVLLGPRLGRSVSVRGTVKMSNRNPKRPRITTTGAVSKSDVATDTVDMRIDSDPWDDDVNGIDDSDLLRASQMVEEVRDADEENYGRHRCNIFYLIESH